jgi:Cof subfamily protein (haloacid dehalogenase superfamily)
MTFSLVAIDLDGTLLNSQHELSPANYAAVRACVERGVRVVVATGRLFASAQYYCRQLGLDGPQITLNGAVLADAESGELRPTHTLPEPVMLRVCDELQRRGIPFMVFGPNTLYTLPGMPHQDVLVGYGEPAPTLVPFIGLAHIPDPAKVLAFLEEGPLDAELHAQFADVAEVVRTGALFYEFMVPGTGKGSALEELMRRYGVPREQVLAIGDSYNDLSMFDVAGFSVAMGGAVPVVRERADATTDDCEHDGVAAALRRYVLG